MNEEIEDIDLALVGTGNYSTIDRITQEQIAIAHESIRCMEVPRCLRMPPLRSPIEGLSHRSQNGGKKRRTKGKKK